jgi:hypothetical protein
MGGGWRDKVNSLPPGGGGRAIGSCGHESYIKLTRYSTEYRIQNTGATKLNSCTCFFIWRWDLMILMGTNPLLRPLEGV